jgi:signal transduction histidine kinase
MQDLIQGLLLYCQADIMDNREECDFGLLLDDVIADFSDSMDQKDFEIIHDPLPSLKVDKIQFRQVFYNLLSNSFKYKKEDIPLKIHISHEIVSQLNDSRPLPYHRINVEDNGIGFEPDHAEKIFGLFQRLHNQSKYTGTGLGLAICRKIIENHGGTVAATGKPGAGATLSIFLPVATAE